MSSMVEQKIIPADPSRTLKVIGSGYSRTGTVSFAMALKVLLKGPVCHCGTACVAREESFIRRWISLLKADPVADEARIKSTLRSLLDGYVGVTDAPAVLFSGELASIYPDAVVICTTRDPERWFRSIQGLAKTVRFWWLDIVFFPMPTLRYFGAWIRALRYRHKLVYNSGVNNTLSPQHLQNHSDYLKRVVPASRLYFFDVKDGWAPLCKILDCPIPDEPFPHANDSAAVQEFMRNLIKASLMRWMQIFVLTGIVVALGVRFLS